MASKALEAVKSRLIDDSEMYDEGIQAKAYDYFKVDEETPKITGILLDIIPMPAHEQMVQRKGRWVKELFEAQTLFVLDTAGLRVQQDIGIKTVAINNTKVSILSALSEAETGDLVSFEYKGTKKARVPGHNDTRIIVPGLKKLV
jgi:hypothetical protein